MFVCDECVDDQALKSFIRDNAESGQCEFCGREADEAIACPVDDFLQVLKDGFEVDWDDALNFMPFDGGDWAIPDAQKDISDVLDWQQLDLQDDLRDAVIRRFEDVTFAPKYFFGASPAERLSSGWNGFVEHVSHHSRYLFLTTGAEQDSEFDRYGIRVADMLRELGNAIHEANLVRPLAPGTVLYRARAHGKNDRPETAAELGAPPARLARISSRMSPHGIPMFYAARECETALKETSSGGRGMVWHLTLGAFEVGSGFQILDLADVPAVPSVFDVERRHLIEPLRFLHVFVDEVRKPIRRNEEEHIEYVPTQIVAEYLRHLYEHQTGERVDGIAYKSAIATNGSNVVLFIDNDDCVDDFAGDDVRKVKLVDFRHLRTELRAV
jgi:HEPN superfamily RES-like protein/RES domain-containing protein